MTATTGVIARWATRRPTDHPTVCGECGQLVDAGANTCPTCRQATSTATGMIAVVIETTNGDHRLVIAERTADGEWAPTRCMDPSPQAVRALARQDITPSAS